MLNHALKGGRHSGRRVCRQDVRRRRESRRQRERFLEQDGPEDGGRPREGADCGGPHFQTGLVNAREKAPISKHL